MEFLRSFFRLLFTAIKFPFIALLFFYESQKSNYKKSSERMEVFRILCGLYLKLKIQPHAKIASYKIFGYTVFASKYEDHIYLFREIFLSKIYLFKTTLKNPVFIDCGANIGFVVLYFNMLFPNSKIIAFEPNPYLFGLLKKNVTENNLKNVEIHNKALSNEKGNISFFFGNNYYTGSIRSDRGNACGDIKEIKVESTLLSDYFISEKPNIIKMDVEGAEIEILQNLVETKTVEIPDQYIIEYHHKINNERVPFSKFLLPFEAKGYDYNLRADYININTFQDILIHFYK